MRILWISLWLVAISIVVVSVVSSVVLPAQCALMGALGGALYEMWRLGRLRIASGTDSLGEIDKSPSWREVIVTILRPILSAAVGWLGLMGATLILRILTVETVEVRPETVWGVSLILGFFTEPLGRRFERDQSPQPSLQDGETRYNETSL